MKTLINIKTDKDVKRKAQKIAEELGLSLSAVINATLKQLARNREVYFSVAPKITPQFENFLGIIEKDIKSKKNISKSFSSTKKAVAYLRS